MHACNLGASSAAGREILWTPVVADAATATLRAAGLRVARRPADYPQHDTARIAVYIHMDGSDPPCLSGASIGFPRRDAAARSSPRGNARTAATFRTASSARTSAPTSRTTTASTKSTAPLKFLVEYGELTCPVQAAWLAPRLRDLGAFTARFIIAELRR